MRKLMIGVAALLVSACSSSEVYPVASTQAFTTLAGIGTPVGLNPLPGGLSRVKVHFESIPADSSVQWKFSHGADDIARIVATVTPDGDAASNVTVTYVPGEAPDENWRNAEARSLIKGYIHMLVSESVDARMENRPTDPEILKTVRSQVTMASMNGVFDDVNKSLNDHIAKRKEAERRIANTAPMSTYAATKPTTDLSPSN